MMSSLLDSLSLRCLWDSWGENTSKKTGLDRAAEPGLEPWPLGSLNGVHGCLLTCHGSGAQDINNPAFLEYRPVAPGHCCSLAVSVHQVLSSTGRNPQMGTL